MPLLLSFFCVFSHNSTRQDIKFRKKYSDSACKIMSYRLNRSVPDFVYHQYSISRVYSNEDPQDFRLPVPCFYHREQVMQFCEPKLPSNRVALSLESPLLSPVKPKVGWISEIFCIFAISCLEKIPRFGSQTSFSVEHLKTQKSQLIHNILCIN